MLIYHANNLITGLSYIGKTGKTLVEKDLNAIFCKLRLNFSKFNKQDAVKFSASLVKAEALL